MQPTVNDFKLHPNIINSIIKAQAGTPAKAFLELVMNSIDAEATQVSIKTDGKTFTVSDDGHGFKGRTEIEDFFGTFGTPHNENDAVYGNYRMGRGQIFSFSKNTWRTGIFEMSVDIEGKGLCYTLNDNLKHLNGCTITGDLYTPLNAYDNDQLVKKLCELVKYAQIPVLINGKKVNTLPQDDTWDIETEFAYIKKKTTGSLQIYNLGVFVCEFHSWDYALCGTVVSKKRLNVNFARNDILKDKCPVWQEISKHLKKNTTANIISKKTLDEGEKINLARRLLCGDIDYMEIRNSPLFTDVTGRDYSMIKLLKESVITVSDTKGSLLADKVQQGKHAWVLTQETLERFGVKTVSELHDGIITAVIQQIDKNTCENKYRLSYDKDILSKILRIDNINHFEPYFNGGYFLVSEDKLSKKQQCVLHVLNAYEYMVRETIDKVLGDSQLCKNPRKIIVGESDLATAWTNGDTMIAIHKNILFHANCGTHGFMYLCSILLHEYLHDNNNAGSNIHDSAFYANYHNIITYRDKIRRNAYDIYEAADKMARMYFRHLKKQDLSVSKSMYVDQGIIES